MVCYFFYGTLMDAAVRRAVLGRDLHAAAVIPAELPGWRRVFRSGATFPVLVPAASRVDGIAADGLTAAEEEKLAYFEGPGYRVRRVTLVVRQRGRMTAFAFLLATAGIASPRRWDYATWQRRHRRTFLEHLEKRGTAA